MDRKRFLRGISLAMLFPLIGTLLGGCVSGGSSAKKGHTYAYRKDESVRIGLETDKDSGSVIAGDHKATFARNDKGEYILTTYIRKGGEWTAFFDSGMPLIQGEAFGADPTKLQVTEDSDARKALKLSGVHADKGYAFDIEVEAYEGNPLIHFRVTNHLTETVTLENGEPRIMLWRQGVFADRVSINQEVPTYQTVEDTKYWCSGFPATYLYTDGMASAFYLDVTDMTWFNMKQGVHRFNVCQVRTTEDSESGKTGIGMDLRYDTRGKIIEAGDMVVDFYLYGEARTEAPTKLEALDAEVNAFAYCLTDDVTSPVNYVDKTLTYEHYTDKIVEGLLAENVSYQWQAPQCGVWDDGPIFTERTVDSIVQRPGYVPFSNRTANNDSAFAGDWNCNNNTLIPWILYARLKGTDEQRAYISKAKPGLLTYFDRTASLFRSFSVYPGYEGGGKEFTFQNYLMQQGTLWASLFSGVKDFDPAFGGKYLQATVGMTTLAHNVNYKIPQLIDVTRMGAASSIDEKELGTTWEVWSGGFYAYNMCLAYSLTEDKTYLDEAAAQLDRLFNGLEYYANSLKQKLLSDPYDFAVNEVSSAPWGIAAAQWLYRLTGDKTYLSYSNALRNLTLRMMKWYESALPSDEIDQTLGQISFFSAFSKTNTTCPWETIETYLPMLMELKNEDVTISQVMLKAFNLFRKNGYSLSGASWDPEVISNAKIYQGLKTAFFMPEDYYCAETPTLPGRNGANNYMSNCLMYAYIMFEAYGKADNADVMLVNVDMCDEGQEMADGIRRNFVAYNGTDKPVDARLCFSDLDKEAKYTLTVRHEDGQTVTEEKTGAQLMSGVQIRLDAMRYAHVRVELADESAMQQFTSAVTAQHRLMKAYAALQTAGETEAEASLSQIKTQYLDAKAKYDAGDYAGCISAVDGFYAQIPAGQ